MKDYRQLIRELPNKTIVLACGKFNPPTSGHELLVKAVKKLAEQKNASHVIYVSESSDTKKNPLIVEKKQQYLNLLFPNTNFVAYADNLAEQVSKLKETYKNVIIVTSLDKVASLKKIKEATVISAGVKDPDADDVTRNYAVKGLYEDFKKNLPSSVRELDSRRLMNDIRIGSGLEPIKEELKLVKDEMREKYFRGEIFNVGEIVESDGVKYEIVKRGSNHLLLKEDSGKLVTKWIQNVKLVEATKPKLTARDKWLRAADARDKKHKETLEKIKSLPQEKRMSAAIDALAKSVNEEHDDHYNNAQMHKENAEKAKARNNMGSYHAHMVNHHDELGKWHLTKGRSSSADREFEKAEAHHDESLKHPYVAESLIKEHTEVEHHKDHKVISHGHAVKITIDKEHHGKIGSLEHGHRHNFKDKHEDHHWVAVRRDDRIHFIPNHLDTQTMSSMSCHIPASDWHNEGNEGNEGSAPQDGRAPFDPMFNGGNING